MSSKNHVESRDDGQDIVSTILWLTRKVTQEALRIDVPAELDRKNVFFSPCFRALFVIVVIRDRDGQGLREFLGCDQFRGMVMSNVSLQTITRPVTRLFRKLEDASLHSAHGRLHRRRYGDLVFIQRSFGNSDGEKVRP